MPNLHTFTAAHAGGTFAPVARLLLGAATACWKRLLAALRESRERQATRVIARYRHLSTDAEQFYEREIEAKPAQSPFNAGALNRTDAAQQLYVDPMLGSR